MRVRDALRRSNYAILLLILFHEPTVAHTASFGMNLESLLDFIEVAAILAFAISGLVEGVQKRMDVVGVFAVAFVAAFGGGTVRDVLLDRRPLFWVQHHEYVWLIAALTVIAPPLLPIIRHRLADRLIQITDAVGLGLFSVSGASLAQAAQMPLVIILLMGVITGILGGVMRDVLCNQIPLVFQNRYPYALCALLGCWVYWLLHWLPVEPWLALSIGAGVATGSRLLALTYNWRIPEWPPART